jgi:hypothetical protein
LVLANGDWILVESFVVNDHWTIDVVYFPLLANRVRRENWRSGSGCFRCEETVSALLAWFGLLCDRSIDLLDLED